MLALHASFVEGKYVFLSMQEILFGPIQNLPYSRTPRVRSLRAAYVGFRAIRPFGPFAYWKRLNMFAFGELGIPAPESCESRIQSSPSLGARFGSNPGGFTW
jgi:hypothetical protein